MNRRAWPLNMGERLSKSNRIGVSDFSRVSNSNFAAGACGRSSAAVLLASQIPDAAAGAAHIAALQSKNENCLSRAAPARQQESGLLPTRDASRVVKAC